MDPARLGGLMSGNTVSPRRWSDSAAIESWPRAKGVWTEVPKVGTYVQTIKGSAAGERDPHAHPHANS